MSNQTTGYICVTVACLCFGSNFVPAKKVDIRDGQYFTLWLAIGIALVGIVQWVAMGMYKFEPMAMIGGATWAMANLFAPFIIKRCGLGIGQLGWCATNMLMGWATGAFGLFGIEKSAVARPNLNYFGVALSVAALLVITQMGKVEEPTQNKKLLKDAEAQTNQATKVAPTEVVLEDLETSKLQRRLRGCTAFGALLFLLVIAGAASMVLLESNSHAQTIVGILMVLVLLVLGPVGVVIIITRAVLQTANGVPKAQPSESPEPQQALSSSFVVQTPVPAHESSSGKDFAMGLVVAMFAGLLMGCNFDIPTLLQQQGESHGHSTNSLDYVFSHYMGILALTTSFFCVRKLTVTECYTGKEVVLPGLLAGVLWGIAQVCWFYANSALSYVVAFPIITGVPGVLAIIWGMLLFGENTDPRSLKLLAAIIALSASSLGCIALSHGASA